MFKPIFRSNGSDSILSISVNRYLFIGRYVHTCVLIENIFEGCRHLKRLFFSYTKVTPYSINDINSKGPTPIFEHPIVIHHTKQSKTSARRQVSSRFQLPLYNLPHVNCGWGQIICHIL